MRSQAIQFAAAAVLVAGIVLLAAHLTGTEETLPRPPIIARQDNNPMQSAQPELLAQRELETAGLLFARQDLAGLVQLLETGQDATKVKVAEYLSQIGNSSALPTLQTLATQWQGPPQDNPFLKAIAAIQERQAKPQPLTATSVREPNKPPAPKAEVPKPSEKSEHAQTGMAGTVVDKLTQKPIQGALVQYMLDNPATATRTDEAGRFVLMGLPPATHTFVHFMAKGYVSERIIPHLVKDQIAPDLLIELDRGSRVEGTVTDPNGKPVAGAKVETFFFTNLPAITGPDGRFEIDGVNPVADSHILQATHPDYPAVSVNFKPAAVGETAIQDLVLKPGADIFGQVTDPNGEPVEGVRIGNTNSASTWDCIKARTDHEGKYRLDNVDIGELILWASHPRYALYVDRTTVEAGTTERRMDIQLQAPVPLHGKVIDDANEPVAGVTVVVHEYDGVSNLAGERYTTDANGLFVIANAPAEGKIVLNPFGGGISRKLQEFELGQPEYILKVHRAGRIYGKVVIDATGEPVQEFMVKMTFSTVKGASGSYSATWNREGYRFKSPEGLFDTGQENLPVGGNYLVTILADGFNPLTHDPVPVQPITDDPNRTVFRLKAVTMLAGVVVDGQGNPVKDATVAPFSKTGRFEPLWWRKFTTDAAGVFVITGIDNEEEFLYVTAPGLDPQYVRRSELDAQGGRPARIVLSGGRLFGRIVDEQGRPRTNAVIHLGRDRDIDEVPFIASLSREAQVDTNGQYELSGLPSGHFWIDVRFKVGDGSAFGDDWAIKKVKLTPGQSLQVNFGDETGFVLTGTVRKGPTPEKGATVEVSLPQGDSKSIRTNDAGAFRLPGIPAGQVGLKVFCHETDAERRTWTRVKEDRTIQVQADMQVDIDLALADPSTKEPITPN